MTDKVNIGSLAIPPITGQGNSAQPALAVKIDAVRWLNPQLGAAIAAIPFAATSITKEEITLPLSPTPEVTDEALFEGADAAERFYLPRYRLAQQDVSGQQQYRARLARSSDGWAWTIFLEKYPAPALGAAVTKAKELDHQGAVLLRYVLSESGGIQKELLFQEVTADGELVRAVLHVNTLAERDELFRALTTRDYKTALIVRRAAQVAIQAEPAKPPDVTTGMHTIGTNSAFNFDTGTDTYAYASTAGASDVVWGGVQQLESNRMLSPRGNARLTLLGPADFDALTFEQLRAQQFTSDPIDNSINNVSSAVLLVTPVYQGIAENSQFAVMVDEKGCIIRYPGWPRMLMLDGMAFSVVRLSAAAFAQWNHDRDACSHIMYIDHPLTNENPDALVFVTARRGFENVFRSLAVRYDGERKKWAICQQQTLGSIIPYGADFNVEVKAPSDSVFIHQTSDANIAGHVTYLDHPLANNNPDAILTVTANYRDVFNDHFIGNWFDASRRRWAVLNQDQAAMPVGAAFNVAIRPPSRAAFIHQVSRANSWEEVTNFDLPNTAKDFLPPGAVFGVLTNGGNYAKVKVLSCRILFLDLQWITYQTATARPALFREVTRVLDDVSSPCCFDRDAHRYMFADVVGTTGGGRGLKRWAVKWRGIEHFYHQEVSRPECFYYVPDAFKLARRVQPPHVPLMALLIESSDGLPEHTQVQLDYTAFKFEDPERLADAARQLRERPNCLPAGVTTPVLMPLVAEAGKTRFLIGLPRGAGGEGTFQPRAGALVSTQVGLKDSLAKLPFNDFQAIWEAMSDPTGAAALFQGQVEIDLGDVTETIPFSARLNDMVGDIFDVLAEADPASGGIKVRLRNAIESRIKVNDLSVKLSGAGAIIPGKIQTIRASVNGQMQDRWPVELAPGEDVSLLVVAAKPAPGAEMFQAVFDFSEVEVTPTIDAILNIISLGQRPEYTKKIVVRASASLFDAPQGQPQDQITDIDIEFERGGTVTLTAQQPNAEVTVRFPIFDLLARKANAGEYRYRVSAVRRGGDSDGSWRSDTRELLRIDSNKVPAAR